MAKCTVLQQPGDFPGKGRINPEKNFQFRKATLTACNATARLPTSKSNTSAKVVDLTLPICFGTGGKIGVGLNSRSPYCDATAPRPQAPDGNCHAVGFRSHHNCSIAGGAPHRGLGSRSTISYDFCFRKLRCSCRIDSVDAENSGNRQTKHEAKSKSKRRKPIAVTIQGVSDERLSPAGRVVVLGLTALVAWLMLLLPAFAIAGNKGIEGLTIAALVCLFLGAPIVWIVARIPVSPNRVWFVVAGMTLRTTAVALVVLVLWKSRTDLGWADLYCWIVVFYNIMLIVETYLALPGADNSNARR
jgi:hypothetical protein